MTTAAVVLGAVAICLVPWLKWAAGPVIVSFEIGRLFERLLQARKDEAS